MTRAGGPDRQDDALVLSTPIIASVFGLILVAELPDKSAIASLVLNTKHRASWVFTGVAAAFALHTVLAVAAGSLSPAIRINHFVVPCSHPAIGTDRPDPAARSMESRAWNKTNSATAARAAMPSAQALCVFFIYQIGSYMEQ
jgi:putative Ca2+/H+ antiporter (TMEM165/GDT1 family)